MIGVIKMNYFNCCLSKNVDLSSKPFLTKINQRFDSQIYLFRVPKDVCHCSRVWRHTKPYGNFNVESIDGERGGGFRGGWSLVIKLWKPKKATMELKQFDRTGFLNVDFKYGGEVGGITIYWLLNDSGVGKKIVLKLGLKKERIELCLDCPLLVSFSKNRPSIT